MVDSYIGKYMNLFMLFWFVCLFASLCLGNLKFSMQMYIWIFLLNIFFLLTFIASPSTVSLECIASFIKVCFTWVFCLIAGSGSSYLYGFFDQAWKEGMTKDEAEVCVSILAKWGVCQWLLVVVRQLIMLAEMDRRNKTWVGIAIWDKKVSIDI